MSSGTPAGPSRFIQKKHSRGANLACQKYTSMRERLRRFSKIRPLLFRRALIARSVPQIPFGHLPLAVRCKYEELCHRSGNWGTARKDFKSCLTSPMSLTRVRQNLTELRARSLTCVESDAEPQRLTGHVRDNEPGRFVQKLEGHVSDLLDVPPPLHPPRQA